RAHVAAIERIAPTLRALRHADGGLARFHGGGRGPEGRLDHALAASGVRASTSTGLSMGFSRLSAGRSSIIFDASAPPEGAASYNGHASTFSFELTSGRRPVIVNCGSGTSFGDAWRRAGRATPSHSTLGIEGYSSARLGASKLAGSRRREYLTDPPLSVNVLQTAGFEGISLQGGHDGYLRTHGLTHVRKLDLSSDGRKLVGEDTLATLSDRDRARFDVMMDRTGLQGIEFAVRFHLHPEVDAEIDMGGSAVSLALKSGEIWVFRHDGSAKMTLEPSVYLEKNRLKPRATKQVILVGYVLEHASRVSWTLAKAQDTPSGLRDLARDDISKN
ncbi:MAG: heparinase II/III family protein, partial [Halocynthiibacter sp.]